MILSAAPIIHARTSEVDFRSELLVIPSAFQPEDVRWARKYILGSTRYFEFAGETGRRVIFSREDIVVSGLSIRIRDLYQLCGKEPNYHLVDGNRTNYAFIGYVIPKESVTAHIDIPYSMYLDLFETYMKLRWNDSDKNPDSFMSTKVPYSAVDFPEAKAVSRILDLTKPLPYAIDANVDTLESICAQATMLAVHRVGFGFCSDIPTANCVLESSFHIVTSKNARSINESVQKQQPSDQSQPKTKKLATTNESGSVQKNLDKKPVFMKFVIGIIAAICIIAIIIMVVSTKQLPN